MTRRVCFVTAVCVTLQLVRATLGQETKPQSPQLKCDIGPVSKTYGMATWLVYSCDDGRTVVIVAAPSNPTMPFYFMFSPHDRGYQLDGEGTGSKDATDAAFRELNALSERDIMELIDQTKRH